MGFARSASFRAVGIRRALPWLLLLVLVSTPWPSWAQASGSPALSDDMRRPKLTKPPRLVSFVEARYPESEQAAAKQASVVLELAISPSGSVASASVVRSAGVAFDSAALAAARQFLFEPAEIDGHPAPIRIQYRYDFVLQTQVATTGSLAGSVHTPSGDPLAGVRLRLDDGSETQTTSDGRFRFKELAPGPHTLTLSRNDLKALQTQETVVAGQELEVSYEVDRAPPPPAVPAANADSDDLEIVVVLPTLSKQVVSVKVDAEQARRVAGTQGDVLKIVENMPGVARASAGSGQIVVWGASPEDTRVYVDDVRVPLLYHFGGLRSVVHTDLVQSVELLPGGYGASYGRGLGGLITVALKEPSLEQRHAALQVDLLDASVSSSGKLAGSWSYAVAGRRSHLDSTLSAATDRDVGSFFPIPRYYDGQLALRHHFSTKDSIEVGGLLSSDSVARQVSSLDPSERKNETKKLAFERVFVRYQASRADGSESRVTAWVGLDRASLLASFGATPTTLTTRAQQYGLRLHHGERLTDALVVNVGLDLEAQSTRSRRTGSVSTPAREGDARTFGQPPSGEINRSDWKTLSGSAAPYLEADWACFGKQLHVVPGMRLEPFLIAADRRAPAEAGVPKVGAYDSELGLEPRLSLRYAPSPRASFKLAWGRYFQAPQAEDQSPVFGNPLLPVARGEHYLASSQVTLMTGLSAETTAFYSHSDELAVRNPSTAPLLGQTLVGEGMGRAFGAQFLIRREPSRGFFGWVAYTLMRAERRDAGSEHYRLFDFDQTHVLTALASYELGRGFDVGVRFRYTTGYPRTPIVGAYFDARRNIYEPVLGAKNSIRIPDFAQLDVRVSKTFRLGGTKAEIYADVQNVTDHENAEELVYNQDYSQRRSIRGLPILPVVGARWEL